MSKHNNSTKQLLEARCNCGRYITTGEAKGGVEKMNYVCPDCFNRNVTKLTSDEFYKQFSHA